MNGLQRLGSWVRFRFSKKLKGMMTVVTAAAAAGIVK